MTGPETLLARTCRALNDRRVQYLVVGERASQLQGLPRAALDIEILATTETSNIERLLEALVALGYIPSSSGLATTLAQRAVTIIGPVAVITDAGPGGFASWAAKARVGSVEGVPVPFAPEWTA